MVLVIHVDNLLDLTLGAKEDTTAVMNVLRTNLHQPLHARVNRETASVLKQHRHGRTLVQNTQLTLGTLLVGRVGKDTAVQQGAVRIGDHGPDVPGGVGLLALAGVLEAVEVGVAPVVPVHAVSLVDGVDGPRLGETHVGVGQDELAQRVLEGEAVDAAAAHGDDQLRRGAVHGEARGDKRSTRVQQLLRADGLALAQDFVGELEDAEDGADGDAGVEVGRAVDGVADDGVAGVGVLVEDDHLFFFLGDEDAALAGAAHRGDEDVIADHVELLLVVARCVGGAGQAGQVDEGGTADIVGDGLEGELEGMAEEGEVARGIGVFGLFFREEAGEGDDVGVDVLLADRRGGSVGCHVDGGL